MEHESRIIDAFASNGINKILLIDDAFDSPDVDDGAVGPLLDFLESEQGRDVCLNLEIEQESLDAAISAAQEGEYESEELVKVVATLYEAYVHSEDGQFDPGEYFRRVKGVSLQALKPIQLLLSKCGEKMEVRTVGLRDGQEYCRNFQPQILFLDYYLDSDVSATDDIDTRKLRKARKVSLDLLRTLVKADNGQDMPAVVLMSSREIDDVEVYRHEAGANQILSLRFGFLKKDSVRKSNEKFEIEHQAADVLLDTSQGYLFGATIQQALTQWRDGARQALDAFLGEIADLHMKDFAYLMRFRLQEEGQPLSEYLEWLFGECLKGFIDEKVNWKHAAFSKLDGEKKIEESIEGAFEGPSIRVAKFFHRVRVDDRRNSTTGGYRLGDIYAQSRGNSIRAVITPDCDLVVRKGRRRVESVLTMGGTLKGFDDRDSVADEFFVRGKTPYCVKWNPKDLQTYSADGEDSLQQTLEFLGTLRPLYAQAMQRRALTDLSRIGLPVAPALGINATVAAWMRGASNRFKKIPIQTSNHLATIIPARDGQKNGHRVLLRRGFFNDLIDYLRQVDSDTLHEADAGRLSDVLKEKGIRTLYKSFLQSGMLTGTKGSFGTGLTLGTSPQTKQEAPWLQITVSVSEEAMEELRTIDPLV